MISLNSNLAPTMLYSNPILFIPAIRATRFKGHLFIIIKMQWSTTRLIYSFRGRTHKAKRGEEFTHNHSFSGEPMNIYNWPWKGEEEILSTQRAHIFFCTKGRSVGLTQWQNELRGATIIGNLSFIQSIKNYISGKGSHFFRFRQRERHLNKQENIRQHNDVSGKGGSTYVRIYGLGHISIRPLIRSLDKNYFFAHLK